MLDAREDATNALGLDGLNDGVSILGETFSIKKALLDINWSFLARWLWDSAVVADSVDVAEDLSKVASDDFESFLVLNILDELGEEWDNTGNIIDASEDVDLDAQIFKGVKVVLSEADFFNISIFNVFVAGEGDVSVAGHVGALEGWVEVVDQVDQSFRVVGLLSNWGNKAGKTEDILQAVLGDAAAEDGFAEAVFRDELGGRNQIFNL